MSPISNAQVTEHGHIWSVVCGGNVIGFYPSALGGMQPDNQGQQFVVSQPITVIAYLPKNDVVLSFGELEVAGSVSEDSPVSVKTLRPVPIQDIEKYGEGAKEQNYRTLWNSHRGVSMQVPPEQIVCAIAASRKLGATTQWLIPAADQHVAKQALREQQETNKRKRA
jgi:hypothetical protein